MPAEVLQVRHERSLTWRASLNLAQSFLDYSAKLIVGLVVVPILVSGLGRSLFGVWEMLGRLVGYMESTDGRPTQALRLVVSNSQLQTDDAAKRRLVGSALAVWLCFLPLWLIAGALLIWLAPSVTKVPLSLHATVRAACGIMMAGLLVAGLASLPESVLRGMNLGYKRMGLQAGLSLAGGGLLAGALYAGWGLPGLATAGALLAGLTGICFLTLVRRQVPWFGIERPHPAEVRTLLSMSLWIAMGDLVAKLLLASDVLVLGMVLSATTVTTYVLTGYGTRLAVNLYSLAADSAMPGLAGIIGTKSYSRAARLRQELLAITALFVTAVGSTILLWNRSFVQLWVGGENYAGQWVTLLLVLIAAQTAFIRCDAYIIDAALQPGRRVQVSVVAAITTLAFTVALTWYAGMVGLCIGILAGRATQMVWYPVLVRRCLGGATELSRGWLVRPLAVMGLLFAMSGYLGRYASVDNWLVWAVAVLLTLALVLAVTLASGMPEELRRVVLARIEEMARRMGPRRGAGA
ncbi:MAG: lipopolysaccharide biosynthesis protein [Gemmatimonadales bacterium]